MAISEIEFVNALQEAGGNVYIVGGFVRDLLRGVRPKDKDYCVEGVEEETFCRLFPKAEKVGRAFPVYLLRIDGDMCEVAFARKEKKIGGGYHGFAAKYDPTVTIAEDLFRRDTTINAMALKLPQREIIDPYGGRADTERKIIRPVSRHFAEDPVRALRAARQAAEFQFAVDKTTFLYMHECAAELKNEPQERLWHELSLALAVPCPSLFFACLRDANVLDIVFPEIFDLIGKTQPKEYHPEGDAFNHSMIVLDKTAAATANPLARFAALVHDIGKGATAKSMLPHHYGHDKEGLLVLARWNTRMKIPRNFKKAANLVIAEHMRAHTLKHAEKKIELLLKIAASPLPIAEFNAVLAADHGEGELPLYLREGEELTARLLSVHGEDAPKELRGEQIGLWIKQQRTKIIKNFEGGQ